MFFSPDTATPEIYTLSLHDALPISLAVRPKSSSGRASGVTSESSALSTLRAVMRAPVMSASSKSGNAQTARSEEHTSELQSRGHLVCRLLLEKKNQVTH